MAMAAAGKYLLSMLMFTITFCCFIGMAHRRESRLDWLILTSISLAAFIASMWSLTLEIMADVSVILPGQGKSTYEGFMLLAVLTALFMVITPASICFLKAARRLAISYFKTGSIVRAGYAFSSEISEGLYHLSLFTRKVRALDFGGKSRA